MKKNDVIRLTAAVFLVLLDGTAMILFLHFPDFFFPAYRNFSKQWIFFLSRMVSFCPGAVWDFLLPFLILAVILTLIHTIRNHKRFFAWFTSLLLIVSVLLSEAVLGWMLNHYAPPLAEELGYDVQMYETEVLYEACEFYLQKASDYALRMDRDIEGHLLRSDFNALAQEAGSIYEDLGKQYPVLQGSNLPVKKLTVVGEYLMYNGIIGMFMPLSGEAGVPLSVPSAPMPYTMAHEAAHRLGIASEEEANFAAFLACVQSDDIRFLYSGYYSAFAYCYSSLYSVQPEQCLQLKEQYLETEGGRLLFLDRSDTRSVYDSYDSPLQEVSDHINDTYLKTFSEESGIQSYGEVTDDLIAWYLAQKK
ncbi:MAG: DUF3810 domain-containing protein [Solobacterium sp.]|nr:DUF3810 domain-containing protein [Solobacterium sp.]